MVERKRLMTAASLVSVVVLCGFLWTVIEGRNDILREGTEIVLETQPIDPRDLLRGHYVQLEFAVEELPVALVRSLSEGVVGSHRDAPVFVRFETGEGGVDTIVEVRRTPPADFSRWMLVTAPALREGMTNLRVEFPIDRYYASEAVAPEIERRMRQGDITQVVLALYRGSAQIKAFRQNGETVFVEPLY